jgi:hypothetical protein
MIVTTEITKQTVASLEGQSQVIVAVEWLIALDDGAKKTYHGGLSNLGAPTDTFIPFSDVTDEQRIAWALAEFGGLDAFVNGTLLNIHDSATDTNFVAPEIDRPKTEVHTLRKVSV